MNVPSVHRVTANLPPLEFESLEQFACGCVALVQLARPWAVRVTSIEAKGPHCVFVEHCADGIVLLGEGWESESAQEGETDDE